MGKALAAYLHRKGGDELGEVGHGGQEVVVYAIGVVRWDGVERVLQERVRMPGKMLSFSHSLT